MKEKRHKIAKSNYNSNKYNELSSTESSFTKSAVDLSPSK